LLQPKQPTSPEPEPMEEPEAEESPESEVGMFFHAINFHYSPSFMV